ncbi:hypothetical protein, partial [Alloprevotella tannerae]|uniref:hypothetical protein n=1 Tax=Alloprevotella tannerae TaxID=76122 RepID=UPI0028E428F6
MYSVNEKPLEEVLADVPFITDQLTGDERVATAPSSPAGPPEKDKKKKAPAPHSVKPGHCPFSQISKLRFLN